MALLLPGMLLISNIPTSSAAAPDSIGINDIGRVTVSGPDILVDGKKPNHQFYGVVDTTALAFAIETYIDGNRNVAGWTSVFNAPDTGTHVPVTPNDTPDAFWNQYFAQMKYYGVNLVRIGAGDTWGTEHQYDAWMNHREEYYDLLHTMSYYAQAHGVWLCFVVAGAQEYPTYHYYGSGSVFEPSSSAFANFIEYSKATMVELENENAIAMYDLFNEPDHNNVNSNYWQGNKVKYNQWSLAVDKATAGVSTHPRTLGVAGFGNLFGMTQEDFDLSTGKAGFEILHRHYYGSNTDKTNFELPEQWAKEVNKPLFWGELANNGPYPLVKYDFGEKAIWSAGGQAITSMVLTGTHAYPYTGGVLGKDVPAKPSNWKGGHSSSAAAHPLKLDFTSSPSKEDKVGSPYEYKVTGNKKASIKVDTDASFLLFDSDDSVIRGIPGKPGNYTIKVIMQADGQEVKQEYTLSVADAPEIGTATINAQEISKGEYRFTYDAQLADGPVRSVEWDFGDGSRSSDASPVHTFAEGEYLVTLTITGENGSVMSTTYGLETGNVVPGAKPGQSIAGAVGWGTTNSVLMIVGLVCASVVGLIGYYSVNRGGRYSYRRTGNVKFPDPRSIVQTGIETVRLLKGMNYPDRKLMKELCLYLLKIVRNKGFGLVLLIKEQALESFKLMKDTASKHLRPRK